MSELLINTYDMKSIEILGNYLKKYVEANQKISIVCIGTDKIIPDTLGPMVGTILSENILFDNIKIIGTLESPLHALNMRKRIKKELGNDELIIAIDASKGNRIGEIKIMDKPISPGKGFLKILPKIGHISIVGTTWEKSEEISIFNHKIRLGDIYKMAKVICLSLLLAIDELTYRNNGNICNF